MTEMTNDRAKDWAKATWARCALEYPVFAAMIEARAILTEKEADHAWFAAAKAEIDAQAERRAAAAQEESRRKDEELGKILSEIANPWKSLADILRLERGR